MDNFIKQDFLELKKLPCWNTNFHRFEGLNNSQDTFIEGFKQSYDVLIEFYDGSPEAKKFGADHRRHIPLGSLREFTLLFKPEDLFLKLREKRRLDNLSSFWLGAQYTYQIFQFLSTYSHPVVKLGDKILDVTSSKSWTLKHSEQFFLFNEQEQSRRDVDLFLPRDYFYLDELFSLKEVFEGSVKII